MEHPPQLPPPPPPPRPVRPPQVIPVRPVTPPVHPAPVEDLWQTKPPTRGRWWVGGLVLVILVGAGTWYWLEGPDSFGSSAGLGLLPDHDSSGIDRSNGPGDPTQEPSPITTTSDPTVDPTTSQSSTSSSPSVSPTPSSTTKAPVATISPSASPTPSISLASCRLPLFSDTYLGFEVGKPADWSINYVNGSIAIRKDAESTTLAFVYPVKPEGGATKEQLLTDYVTALDATLKADGGSLSVSGNTLTGSVKGTAVTGTIEAVDASPQIILRGGWAPTGDWNGIKQTISDVGTCYQRTLGKVAQRQTQTGYSATGASTTYSYLLPDGWSVAPGNVNANALVILKDQFTGASFSYLTGAVGNQTPDGYIDLLAESSGYTDLVYTGEQELGSTTDSLGYTWEMKAKEYTAKHNGQSIQGIVTAAIANIDYGFGYGSYSAMANVRQAKASEWDEYAAITAVVQESIQITNSTPGKSVTLPRNNPADSSSVMSSWEYKNQVDDRLSAKRSEAIGGYESVRSPSTGQTYDAPYNSYNPTGPDGAGYYRSIDSVGGVEKLESVY